MPGAGGRFLPPKRALPQRLPARDDTRTLPGLDIVDDARKRRRSSTAADSSPRCSKAVRIAAVVSMCQQAKLGPWRARSERLSIERLALFHRIGCGP